MQSKLLWLFNSLSYFYFHMKTGTNELQMLLGSYPYIRSYSFIFIFSKVYLLYNFG